MKNENKEILMVFHRRVELMNEFEAKSFLQDLIQTDLAPSEYLNVKAGEMILPVFSLSEMAQKQVN